MFFCLLLSLLVLLLSTGLYNKVKFPSFSFYGSQIPCRWFLPRIPHILCFIGLCVNEIHLLKLTASSAEQITNALNIPYYISLCFPLFTFVFASFHYFLAYSSLSLSSSPPLPLCLSVCLSVSVSVSLSPPSLSPSLFLYLSLYLSIYLAYSNS